MGCAVLCIFCELVAGSAKILDFLFVPGREKSSFGFRRPIWLRSNSPYACVCVMAWSRKEEHGGGRYPRPWQRNLSCTTIGPESLFSKNRRHRFSIAVTSMNNRTIARSGYLPRQLREIFGWRCHVCTDCALRCLRYLQYRVFCHWVSCGALGAPSCSGDACLPMQGHHS